jgi:hypothetical protein
MRSRTWIATGLAAAWLFAAPGAGFSRAGEHSHGHEKSTKATPHTFRQAGYPQCVSPVSMVSYNEHYSGGYVGGGKAHGGNGPCPHQGTWGWDYTPFRSTFLGWSQGRRYQGGTGSYTTDGPKPLEHITETIHGHFGGGD